MFDIFPTFYLLIMHSKVFFLSFSIYLSIFYTHIHTTNYYFLIKRKLTYNIPKDFFLILSQFSEFILLDMSAAFEADKGFFFLILLLMIIHFL